MAAAISASETLGSPFLSGRDYLIRVLPLSGARGSSIGMQATVAFGIRLVLLSPGPTGSATTRRLAEKFHAHKDFH